MRAETGTAEHERNISTTAIPAARLAAGEVPAAGEVLAESDGGVPPPPPAPAPRPAPAPAPAPARATTPAPAPAPTRAPTGAGPRRLPTSPFRLPLQDDPAPPYRRMIAMSAWAALLTLVGMAVAGRAFLATLFTPDLPGWFQPAILSVGLAGILLTVLALATVQHRRLPWLLLPGATAALAVALLLTTVATSS